MKTVRDVALPCFELLQKPKTLYHTELEIQEW